MKKLIMWNVISLDGYFEGAKPWDLDFHELAWGKELEAFSETQLASADVLVFGEITYTGMAAYWSKVEGKTAEMMNAIPKIVCSPTLENVAWNNTTIVRDAVAEISQLKQAGEGNMFLFGSAVLSESLMNAQLFDEYRLVIVPVILGNGRRLFTENVHYQELQLLETLPLETGGIILRYSPRNNTVQA